MSTPDRSRTDRIIPSPAGDRNLRVLVGREDIARRVGELGDEIARTCGAGELTLLAVLTGSLVFLADLIRRLPHRMRIDLVSVSSYPGAATKSQGVEFASVIPPTLAGRDVLIVDDILDSGRTLTALTRAVAAQHPASVRSCVLLRKRRDDIHDRPEADFVGFDVPDEFVVGYGLDYDGLYRNLPDIDVLASPAGGRP